MNDVERKSLQQSLREAWMGALGVAESEAGRATQRLLEAIGLRHDGAPPTAGSAVNELLERVRKNRDELERLVDEGVRAALHRVHRPIADELAAMRGRIDTLQRRMDERKARDDHPTDGA